MSFKASIVVACALMGSLAFGISSASSADLIAVPPVPGSDRTVVYGINDNNVIVGTYFTGGAYHGFFGTLDGNYQTFDVGPGFTEAHSINNDNYIVGSYDDHDGDVIGFERYPDGHIAIFTIDGRIPIATGLYSINAKGVFVGSGVLGTRIQFFGKDGAMSREFKPRRAWLPFGINDSGAVVGYTQSWAPPWWTDAFVYHNQQFTKVARPSLQRKSSQLVGINNAGVAVGNDYLGSFAYDITTKVYTDLKISGAWVSPHGINSAGMIAVSSQTGSYIYCLTTCTVAKRMAQVAMAKLPPQRKTRICLVPFNAARASRNNRSHTTFGGEVRETLCPASKQ